MEPQPPPDEEPKMALPPRAAGPPETGQQLGELAIAEPPEPEETRVIDITQRRQRSFLAGRVPKLRMPAAPKSSVSRQQRRLNVVKPADDETDQEFVSDAQPARRLQPPPTKNP